MAPSQANPKPGSPGSIEDISRRLALWTKRDSSGLVRVEYSSEFARQRVMQQLQSLLTPQGTPLEEIALPTFQDAETVVQTLVKRLEEIAAQPCAVVSITGFATAFDRQFSLEDALRVLNFNRDRYVSLPLQQIWWMTPAFMQRAVHAMPDLNGFFLQQLQLTEVVLPEAESQKLVVIDGFTTNIDDARQRAYGLIRQFEAVKTTNAPPADLLNTYVLPALEALAEVGAQKELRDLTQQFEGILSQIKSTDSPELATSLDRLASLYADQGRYSEAEPLYLKSLALRKQLLGEAHPDVAASLNNLACLYYSQGRYSEAEPLFQEALALRKQLLGEAHPDVAHSINNLALLYKSQGRYSEAELLYQSALALYEQLLGEAHPAVATSLNNLAALYNSQGRYSEAEPFYQKSLAIDRKVYGDEHSEIATDLNNLAALYRLQGRYSEAEPLYQEALTLWKQLLGNDHPDVATSLWNLGALRYNQGRLDEAKSLLLEALPIYEAKLGPAHPDTQSLKGWVAMVQTALDAAD